jgi:copper oxidase (laccase) domain-containing protein
MDTDTSNGHRISEFGEAALTGWRGAAGRAIAKPIAKRTRFSQQQIEAAIGIALVAYAIYRVIRPSIRTARR